jgi:hypothetical protein
MSTIHLPFPCRRAIVATVAACVLTVSCSDLTTNEGPTESLGNVTPSRSGFRLTVFPLPGQTHSTAKINAVFDHSVVVANNSRRPITYCPNDTVTAYTGEEGRSRFASDSAVTVKNNEAGVRCGTLNGFQQDAAGTAFRVNGQYDGDGKPQFLYYDGHPGYDYKTTDVCPGGTPTAVCSGVRGEMLVLAAASGTVMARSDSDRAYGRVKLAHPGGYETWYMHLDSVRVVDQESVSAGDVLGFSGSRAPFFIGPHLHFEVRFRGVRGVVPADPYGWTAARGDPYETKTGVPNAFLWADEFWTPTNFALLPGVGVYANVATIVVGPADVLYAGVSCYAYDPNCQGVFRSLDHGASWSQANTGLTTTNVTSITVTPAGNLVAGTHGGTGVFRSGDGGDTWAQTGLTIPHVTHVFSTRDAVYAFDGFFCTGTYRSDDDGVNWVSVNNGLATCDNGFAAAPTGDTLYVGTGTSGIFRSVNRGASWVAINSGLTNSNVSSMVMNSQGYLFAATVGGGVFRSTDKGNSWTGVNSGLPAGGIDPGINLAVNRSDHLFASLSAFGVHRSTDNGGSWLDANSGLTVPPNGYGGVVLESTGIALVSNGLGIWRSTRSTTRP